jgi:exonuclease III
VRGERQPDLTKQISNFVNVKNTVGKLWIVIVVVVVPYIRNLLDKLRSKPIVLIKSLKMCFNNYYTISISASESLYKKCEKCHPQILTNPVNIIFMLFNVSMSCKLCSGNKTLLTDRLFFYSNPNTYNPIINSDILMTSVTIALLLICAGVELNPGPRRNMEIITYNCNGLGDKIKLRRLLAKVNKKVQNGAIIFLQETHIVNTEHLKSIWSNKFLSNCKKTNSAGVIILFNNRYDVKYHHEDLEGRAIVASLTNKDNDKSIIVANVYFPNDHKSGIAFAESTYLKILEAQTEHPENITICAGDFNMCMNDEDSIGRNETKNERLLADVIKNNNKVTNLKDCYRSVNSFDGYTWKRGTIYSRLDYVFATSSLLQRITKAEIDWAFETSDHAAVKVGFLMDEPEIGPGITKINTRILEDKNVEAQIGLEIEQMMKQADENWDPHMTLEFMKVVVRSVFSLKVSEIRKYEDNVLNEKEEEMNQFENLRMRLRKRCTTPTQEITD